MQGPRAPRYVTRYYANYEANNSPVSNMSDRPKSAGGGDTAAAGPRGTFQFAAAISIVSCTKRSFWITASDRRKG